ncbi:RagB/SusD family nutrient uptake outer membrane protein [Pedobacter sp. MC2016-24]|uniref:RagB/SusD family nutrient uptake outer membrane protein n=1 Tax=Pedobacter sp. MC2016-24 TaxID=2780090 RepID=UPI0018800497|nr:RagB/SusD family nutrient uptake outer membrane protein [Pedobacter sp. MC2016-24]MBE9601304.1 RagB/SusD family nutrient uptake outer membrane protein [Pedobacter sp. MC2016-24]
MKTKILILLIGIMMASCSKLLDKDPDFVTPETYYKTEEDLKSGLNGVYNRLIDQNGRMYGRGLFSYFVVSDEAFFKSISINNIRVMVMDASHLDIGRLWETLYEGVNRANLLLEQVDQVNIDQSKKDVIKGEALFLRGYYYYLLADIFGPVPLKLNATTSPNDPYLPRAPLAEVYAAVVKDMQQAELLVSDIDQFSFNERISKTGVQAILARVFLKMAGAPLKDVSKYKDALDYANKVITSNKHALNLNYKQIFINHTQDINEKKECIWEIGMYGNKVGTVDLAGSMGVENGIECPSEAIGYSGGAMKTTAKLYQLFGTADTARRNWSIAPYRFVTTSGNTVKSNWTATQIYDRNPGKWRREYETGSKARSYTSTNFPVIRYSDVLLMKAEAENEVNSGPTAAAYDAINKVRRRAFNKPLDKADALCDVPAGLNKIGFLTFIQDERARELCFEGIRKHDLIRWDIYVKTMNDLGESITATSPSAYKYAANAGKNTTDRDVLFPIPTTEITVNKLIKQNYGW